MSESAPRTRVVVAMSGGVDSSVAAALLVERGYEVVGLMMRLWGEAEAPGAAQRSAHNRCCTPDAIGSARRVAAQLDIPFYVIDAQDVFKREVVEFFIDGYARGVTPNPCVECNRHIRWDFLLHKALALRATHMATGHYARVRKIGGEFQLLRAVDLQKDQSYVLSVLGQEQLGRALFPIGDYTKAEVRELARGFDLPISERGESQDLCFLADNDYRRFLRERAPAAMRPGPILDRKGRTLGVHTGLAGYTIGQRKGLRISAPQPLYVVAKEPATNTLRVAAVAAPGRTSLRAARFRWTRDAAPDAPIRAGVKIRYRARAAAACVRPVGADSVEVEFDEPQRDITPGQAAVVYDGDVCLGGGIIQ